MFIVSLFSKVFLQTPTNEKIVDYNARSIVSFVDFSSKKYSTEENCYTMLKLENLENYQFTEDGRNYFYVIGKKGLDTGVYIIKMEYLKNVYETESLNDVPAKFYKFKQDDIKLMLDDTADLGFTLNVEIFSFGGVDTNLKLEEDVRFILLVPDFDVKLGMFTVEFLNKNQNVLRGKIYKNDDEEEPEGFHLGFNSYNGELFLTKSDYSNSLIGYKSCFSNEISQNYYEQIILNDPQLADFVNKKLIFDYVDENGLEYDFKFVWSVNGIECPTSENKKCVDYLGDNFEELTYDEFRKKVRDVYNNKFKDTSGVGGSKLVDIKELNYEDIINGNLENIEPYDYESLFVEYDMGHLYRANTENVMRADFGDFAFQGFKEENIECDDNEFCDYGGFKNGNIYYYNPDFEGFVMFNINMLRKYNNEYYFVGEKIDLNKGKFDDVNWSPLRKDFEFYSFNIPTELGTRTVFLSKAQLSGVRSFSGGVEE
ncbi:MAG: hypothetical protein PF569_07790 [Candidatus Woesearchaeota archaeon]|jgi:hypothetical protein|nr:hypothetical protein [Candidatus Woesearchaeota archaeon]